LFKDFDRERVVQQLRYSGMMETINIRRVGYPIRHDFNEFVHRYASIAPAIEKLHKKSEERGDRTEQRSLAVKICEIALAGQDYQIGKHKVFLKDEHDAMLENARKKVLADKILALQKAVRRFYAQRRFEQAKKLAHWLQQSWLCYAERRAFCEVNRINSRTCPIKSKPLIRCVMVFDVCKLPMKCNILAKNKSYTLKLCHVYR
jgi:myosin VIIa